ncbi:hypothetical protein AX774_g6293 [Zancudomyces culisetae]|uniref:Uncharacterized protein n=1 Tax=Zancudomyces culisetae TaxID=1213189 RepID=A0A1R1PH24_ZANCU|nr:hypothetical protein AX774_g6293 [Zancudomyces culisetae]|eukprot:OMH80274.1 hypothetical protein AX774_g6293 [Zancudomyces culisetae]
MDSQIAETNETIHELKNLTNRFDVIVSYSSKTRHSEEIARVKKKGLCLANTILSAEAGTGAFFRVGSPSRAASQGLDIDICTKDHIRQLKKGWEALFKM